MSSDDRERAVADAVPNELFINGRWRPSGGGKFFDVEDPSTGKVLRAVADATREDGMAALDAAVAAQAGWAQYPPRERSDILCRAYELMMARQEDLALLMTLEMGKPVAESRARSPTPPSSSGGSRGNCADRRRLRHRAQRLRSSPRDAPAGWAVAADHPLELPRRNGHPQDRPSGGGGLHDGAEASQPDPAVDARDH